MFIQNLAYEASAGSGKTFMLVVRYLSLLFQGADATKILALTFTNKAANEMAQRIVETLESLENRGELDEIIKVTELSKEEILSKREYVLATFLQSHTKIMTIDSFFTQILRKFSLYASLMPDFSTHAAQHEIKLLNRFLLEVSAANEGQTLVNIALESNKRFFDIFSFLDELYQKESELPPLVEPHQSTLHSCEVKVMEALHSLQTIVKGCKGASATLKKAVDISSFEELIQKTWITKESLEYWVFKKCFTPEMDVALSTIQQGLCEYYQLKEYYFFRALYKLLHLYKKAKQALYKEESELGFSDVTQLVYEILHRIQDSEFLYFRLDSQIEHMLLDEFQDTSIVQYKILNPLIEEITSGEGIFKQGSFFFVGDVKQSIYRFRGGVSALFHVVAQEHKTHIEKLRVNYRSKQEVVDFVNRTFEKKIQNYTPQEVREDAHGGYVEVLSDASLIECLIQKVLLLLEKGAKEDDIAILCATNGDGETIKEHLLAQGLRVVTETTAKLINQKGVQAILEYLKYLYFREEIYRQNFFALVQREPEIIAKVDFSQKKLFDIVYEAIHRYKLFHDDMFVVRFLNILSNYDDIEALLFEYERIEETTQANELQGVRVLTIHKSKGLEYKHVIVLDRLGKPPAARNAIIYEYEGIRLQKLYLRTKARDALDRTYAQALQKEQNLVYEDTLNALYVAFTRAKENLFILQKEEKSSFDVLNLEDGCYGVLEVTQTQHAVSKPKKTLVYEELYYGTQSELLAYEEDTTEDLQAVHFGTAMHYMLEMLESFTPQALEDAKDMMINKYGFMLQNYEIKDIVLRVERLVNYQPFLSLLQGKIYKEKALKYKKNLRYLDLLIETQEKYIVIDYKSSKHASQSHIKQVQGYKKALRSLAQGKDVHGYLCYLHPKEIELIPV